MEKSPNPFTSTDNNTWRRWETQPIIPEDESPSEARFRRHAFKRWYLERQRLLRERYHRFRFRRSREKTQGAVTFKSIGEWVVLQAMALEDQPNQRRQRQKQLTKQWQQFVRRAFYGNAR